jgi:hypothetical protein
MTHIVCQKIRLRVNIFEGHLKTQWIGRGHHVTIDINIITQ